MKLTAIISSPYICAKSLSRLLLVNRLTHSEALPIFYEHHHFRLLMQNLFLAPPPPILAEESHFELLVHLELVYEEGFYELNTPESDVSIYHHLRFVQERCLSLKDLRLELRSRHEPGDFFHPRYRDQRFLSATKPWPSNHLPSPYEGPHMINPSRSMTCEGCAPSGIPFRSSRNRGSTASIFNMRPAPGRISGENPPPPRMTQPCSIQRGTCFIDREGASVQCLKEIWGRLEKLTIAVPHQAHFGESDFQQYMYENLQKTLVPEVEWVLRTVDYNSENESSLGTRLLDWSVSREMVQLAMRCEKEVICKEARERTRHFATVRGKFARW